MLNIDILPAFTDNYIYMLYDDAGAFTAVVDAGQAEPVLDWLSVKGRGLTHILDTHHHADHIGGNAELLRHYPECHVIGPLSEVARIPHMTQTVVEGAQFTLGDQVVVHVIETPGHTTGHIIFYIPDENVVFVGDTLFSMGCGRLFEGTPEQMWQSLLKLRALPEFTDVYAAHEYTLDNGRFAMTIEPGNQYLKDYIDQVRQKREQSLPSLPTSIGVEKKINPFLRADMSHIQEGLGMSGAVAEEVFAEIRRRKDCF